MTDDEKVKTHSRKRRRKVKKKTPRTHSRNGRRKVKEKVERVKIKIKNPFTLSNTESFLRGGPEYRFWLFHGVNYLSSPRCPFPDIYSGDSDGEIYPGAVFDHIVRNYLVGDKPLTPQGRACLLWSSMRPWELKPVVSAIRGFAKRYKRDPRSPNDPYVSIAIHASVYWMVRVQDKGRWKGDYSAPWDYYYERKPHYEEGMYLVQEKIHSRAWWNFWKEVHRRAGEMALPPQGAAVTTSISDG